MAEEDIDIEEHDLFDNPLLRNMFPDLSIIKKEISEFDVAEPVNEAPLKPIKRKKKQKRKITVPYQDPLLEVIKREDQNVKQYYNVKKYQKTVEQEMTIKNENMNDSNESSLNIKSEYETNKYFNVNTMTDNDKPSSLEYTKETTLKKTKQIPEKVSSNLEIHRKNLSVISRCKNASDICMSSKTSYSSNIEDSIKQKKKSKEHLDSSPIKETSRKSNKVTVISKPNTGSEVSKNITIVNNLKVSLQNLQPFLSKSSRYCKLCLRLFPSIKALSDHNNGVHPQTGKINSHETQMDRKSHTSGSRFRCNLCKIVCSTSYNLIRHKRIIHLQNIKKVKKVKIPLHPSTVETKNKEKKFYKCTHCSIQFASQPLLIDHMYNVLQSKNKNLADFAEKTNNVLNKEKITTIQKYYRCTLCSYYFKTDAIFFNHLKNIHKKPVKEKWEKVAFDPTCKLCNRRYANILSFNAHAWKVHQKDKSQSIKENKTEFQENHTLNNGNLQALPDNVDINFKKLEDCSTRTEVVEKKKNSLFILKSALFKCIKCDICFLSGSKAVDHIKHMDELINWKCLKCFRIFKKDDELLHTYQHLFSDKFDVFEIRTTAILSLLYKCPNCITYFFEKDLYSHYSICKLQPPNSSYCKICDILIDIKIQEQHDKHHNIIGKELTNIFVESDLIEYIEENVALEEENEGNISDNNTKELKKDILQTEEMTDLDPKVHNFSSIEKKEQMLSFVFCNKCKSFISKIHNIYNHTKAPCSNQISFVCKYCGLIISSKLINRHRKVHQRIPGLTLKDFTFYDLKGHKIRRPPIPKYPSCNKCSKHFITKTAIISHKCHESYSTCPICDTKFSNSAFSLHMAFHNYSHKNNFSEDPDNLALSNLKVKPETFDLDQTGEISAAFLLVYICKSCKIAVDVYDKVVEHCQEHLSGKPTEATTIACGTCNIIFDVTCYDNHKMLHANSYNKQFTILNFDVFYATSDITVWLDHLFGTLPKETINQILEKSIYNTERRIKLRIVQNGLSHLTFFKCAKCNTFLDSSLLYEHCHNNTLCQKLKSIVCSHCSISLVSEEFRMEHEKIHYTEDVTFKSYRIVLFNCEEDESTNRALSFPNKYILFECRNCNGIVDKRFFKNHKCNLSDLAKCSHCGLLLYTNDYMAHVLKHKEFCSFIENNIKVISIGHPKVGPATKGRLMPSFSGIKLNYLVYQCADCLVCLKEKKQSLTHTCVVRNSLKHCSECGLYFKDHKFAKHRLLHEFDAHFVKDNITTIQFRPSSLMKCDEDVIILDDEDHFKTLNLKNHIERHPENVEANKVVVNVHNLYQCNCGVHFLNESSAISHYKMCSKNPRSVKQICPKCGLYFKPNVLFEHLLAHHGSKNISPKFNIIGICENMPSTSQTQNYV